MFLHVRTNKKEKIIKIKKIQLWGPLKTVCVCVQASCKVLHFFHMYMLGCNYFWMLCEGIYLHTLIVVAVFVEEQHLHWYYLLGWGEFNLLPPIPPSLPTSLPPFFTLLLFLPFSFSISVLLSYGYLVRSSCRCKTF